MIYNYDKIKSIIINIYMVLTSSIIIGLFIYFRLIKEYNAYSLENLKGVVNIKYFCFCILMLFLHLIVIISIIYIFKNKEKRKESFFNIFKFIIEILVWKPLDYILIKISPYIPYSGTVIISYCNFFRKNEIRLFLMKFFCIFFYYLPRIIMSILFFTEIIFYHQLKYFFNMIFLLLVPFCYIIFINLCEKFYYNNIENLTNVLLVLPIGEPNKHGVYINYKFSLKPNLTCSDEAFKQLVDSWNLLFYLINLNKIIRNFISNLNLYISLVTSTLYMITFSYKIYYLFIS
jgi:hypothetical protein